MSDSDGCAVAIGGILALAAIAFAVFILVVYVLPTTLALGGLAGGSVGIHNYMKSFFNNVRPESDPDGNIAKVLMVILAIACILVTIFGILALMNHFEISF